MQDDDFYVCYHAWEQRRVCDLLNSCGMQGQIDDVLHDARLSWQQQRTMLHDKVMLCAMSSL